MSSLGPKKEQLLYHAVEGVSLTEILGRVNRNSASLNIEPNDEVQEVVVTLFRHYQANIENDQCQDVHRDLRFLEQAFAAKGGGKYLESLFPPGEGVIRSIHLLAGLPQLEMDIDPGVGSAL